MLIYCRTDDVGRSAACCPRKHEAPGDAPGSGLMMMIYYKKSLVKKDETRDAPLSP